MSRKQEPVSIPTLDAARERLLHLPEDLALILAEGIGPSQLARTLRVSRTALFYWRKGYQVPREPLITLCILTWADRLRNGGLPQ